MITAGGADVSVLAPFQIKCCDHSLAINVSGSYRCHKTGDLQVSHVHHVAALQGLEDEMRLGRNLL
jgi:hypothetical protein